ncbi:MAG: hypothetical protein ACOCRK_01645 [bacterium]
MIDNRKKQILKGKTIIVNKSNYKDLRVVANKVEKLNLQIQNLDNFEDKMENLGYKQVSKRFLVKNFNGIEINITRNKNEVQSITAYKKNEVVEIPQNILNQVKNEINSCL